MRSWNVYYLQNSRSNDIAYVLQQAFTPNHVTAVPSARAARDGRGCGRSSTSTSGNGGSGFNQGGTGGGRRRQRAPSGGLSSSAAGLVRPGRRAERAVHVEHRAAGRVAEPGQPAARRARAERRRGGSNQENDTNAIRIIPNGENNAVLIYATPQERDTIEAMLRKIDILPLQVRIDAAIAEVTLNDTLQYGTQFFFKAGGVNGALNFNTAGDHGRRLRSAASPASC